MNTKFCPCCGSGEFAPNPNAGGGVSLYLCSNGCEFDEPTIVVSEAEPLFIKTELQNIPVPISQGGEGE